MDEDSVLRLALAGLHEQRLHARRAPERAHEAARVLLGQLRLVRPRAQDPRRRAAAQVRRGAARHCRNQGLHRALRPRHHQDGAAGAVPREAPPEEARGGPDAQAAARRGVGLHVPGPGRAADARPHDPGRVVRVTRRRADHVLRRLRFVYSSAGASSPPRRSSSGAAAGDSSAGAAPPRRRGRPRPKKRRRAGTRTPSRSTTTWTWASTSTRASRSSDPTARGRRRSSSS